MRAEHFIAGLKADSKVGSQKYAFPQCVNINLPVPLLGALLGAPQGSPFLDPSPKGSLDGEESEGGAAEPHTSSVLTGAAATKGNTAQS